MARRSAFCTLGLIWDLLRFSLLFLFLLGNDGTSLIQGNFYIILLGVSGQPALFFLWIRLRAERLEEALTLFAVRLPGLILEFLAVLLLFTGRLPGEGNSLVFENRIFPGGTGILLLLIILLADFIFQLFLVLSRQKES